MVTFARSEKERHLERETETNARRLVLVSKFYTSSLLVSFVYVETSTLL